MRISVEPEALRALSRQLEQSGEQIRQMTTSLNQALGSLMGETSIQQSLLNEWQIANRQGEQIFAILTDMGRRMQSKATEFQTADQQHNSILSGTVASPSPVSMFQATANSDNGSILPGYANGSSAISNPLSAIYAVNAEAGTGQGQISAGWAALGFGTLMAGKMVKSGFNVNMKNNGAVAAIPGAGPSFALNESIKGVSSTLTNAAKNPQIWKFVDPKVAAKQETPVKGNGGRFGAAVGLASGAVIAVVTDIEINGKSLKTYAVDGVDAVIDGTVDGVKTAAEGVEYAAKETFNAVTDSVKAVSHGASKIADQVIERLGSLGRLFA